MGSPPGTDETGARKEGTDMTGTQADVAIGTLRHCFETAQEMVREALDKRPDATTSAKTNKSQSTSKSTKYAS